MKDQLERNLYQHLLIGFSMGLLTIWLSLQPEPTWIPAPQAIELRRDGATFLDTRLGFAYAQDGMPGALNIPSLELPERLDEVPRDRPVVVYGAVGDDSLPAYRLLKERGYDVYDLGPKSRFPTSALHDHSHHHVHAHGAGGAPPRP